MKQKLPTKSTLRHLATTLALAAMVLFAPTAWGQGQLTVYESATGTNEYIPIYGYWADSPQHNQMLYPASELTDMTDSVITQMVFYLASGFTGNNIGNWTISLGETTSTTLGGLDNSTVLTQVYSGGMNIDATTGAMTITFSEGYVYNGGNLLVDFTHAAASYRSMTFYGESVTSASLYQYSNYSAVTQDFLPKVTFSYEAAPSCLKPTDVAVSNEATRSATLGWTENGTATAWQICLDGDESNLIDVTTNPYTLTGLTPETSYTVKVRANCGTADGTSQWSNQQGFTTTVACPAPTNLTVPETDLTAYGATATWNGTSNSYVVMIGEPVVAAVTTDFEDQAIPATFTNDASRPWTVTAGGADGSGYCAIPGNNGVNSSQSDLTCVVTGPCTVSFKAKISSEEYYDYGRFFIDGVQQFQISGTQDWTDYSYPIGEGTHTLTWRYYKDGSSSSGSDLFYVDNITIPGLAVSSWTEYTTSQQSYTFTGLTPETTYQVKVKGNCGDDGYSQGTNPVTFTTTATCPVPTNLAVTPGSETGHGAEISWTGNNDSYIIMLGEEVTAINADFESGVFPADFTTNVHPWTVVANDHSGAYCAKSGNGGVNSSTSEMVLEVTLSQDATLTFSAKISSESGWDKGYFSIDGTIQSNLNAISGNGSWIDYSYALTAGTHLLRWYYTKDSSTHSNDDCLYVDDIKIATAPSTWDETRTAPSSPYTLTGLNPGTTYQVKVKGVCGSEQSAASDAVAFTTAVACPAPTGLAVDNTSITTNSATLNWTAGAVETAWDIFYTSDATLVPDNTTLPTTTASNNPTASISGLSEYTYYYVYVRANCGTDDGVSAWSAVESFQTLASCQAPQNLTATNLTANGATLTWTDPNSGTVDGYTIKLWDGAVESDVATVTTTSYSLTTLNPITTYTFRVYVNCSSTETSDYAEVTFTTLCGNITTFPWSENFESYAAGDFSHPCWVNEHITGNGSQIFKVYTSTNGTNSTHQLQLPDMTSGTQTKLRLPEMTLNGNYQFVLDVYRSSSTYNSDYAQEGIRVFASANGSLDGATEITFIPRNYDVSSSLIPAEDATGWYTYELPIPITTGTCYIILRGESQYCTSTYMDNFVVELAPTCFQPIAAVATNVLQTTATLNWTRDDRNATGETYSILDENGDPLTDPAAANISGTTYTLNGLTENTTYTFYVQTNCANSSESVEPVEVTFTTLPFCPAPVLEATDITNITAHNATVEWTGNPDNESYTVSYRTAAYFDGLNEEFGTSLPTGWENKTGLLSSIMGGSAFGTTTQWSFGTNNGVFDNHARINIYGTSRYGWLITPATSLGTGYALNFDLALTAYSGTGAASGTCDDDRFVILVSTDDEATWTILREWNNSGSADVYNTIATAGENVTIDLSSYAGQSVRIAFYGESTVTSNGDNNLHIDNVMIGAVIPAGAWTDVTNADNPTTLTTLAAETLYDVKVTGICTTGTNESATQQFTTPEACPAPTALTAGTPEAWQAQLSWTENGSASNWIVAYKTDAAANFTEVSVTNNPYTLIGLTPETQYTIKVRANCGINGGFDDGTSDWSNIINYTTEVACHAPTDLAVDNASITTNSADISWLQNNGSAMDWTVAYKAAGDADFTFIDEVLDNDPYTLENLTENTTYTVKVRAFCGSANGYSVWTPEVTFTTLANCPVPTNLTVTDGSNPAHEATVTWTAGNTETDWVLEYATASDFTGATSVNVSNTPTASLTGLTAETMYYVRVKAVCSSTENSDWVSTDFTTGIACPAPTDLTFVSTALDVNVPTTANATITWTKHDESSWMICVNDDETGAITVSSADVDDITNNTVTYTLTGLTPSTTYSVKVRANCGIVGTFNDGVSAWSSSIIIPTACAAIATATLPWEENFDSYTGSITTGTGAPSGYPNHTLPNCWDFLNMSTTSGTFPQAFLSTKSGYVVSGNCLFLKSSNTTPMYAILPEFEDDIADLQLAFTYRNEGTSIYNGILYAGYMTDPTDASTFTPVYTCAQISSLTTVSDVQFLGAPAGSRIAFRYTGGSNSNYYLSIDNVVVDAVPSCLPPQNLTATNVTATGATLNWTDPNSSVEDYSVMIILNGTDEVYHSTATSTSHPITNLAPATTYTFRVYTNCSSTESSPSYAEVTFTTACAAITTLPWTEDFESLSTNTVPTCWDNSASTAQEITSHPDYIWGVYENSSNKMIRMHNYFVHPGTALINTPTITLPTSGECELTFDYSHRASCDAFTVKISTDGGANFTDLQQYTSTSTSFNYTEPVTFTAATVSLAGYTGDIILQFFANADYDAGAIFIDNVSVHLAPCAAVSDLVATATTATTATLSWTENGTATAWTVVYATANDFSEATSVDVSGTPTTTLNSLTPATTYYVRVKSSCSDWSNVYSFTTQSAATLDIEANKWYAISSPMHDDGAQTESLANITNLLPTAAGDFAYDLFRYDEATSTWESQQNTVHTDFDVFEQARGYIYRRDNTATLTFAGTPNTGNISIDLTADADGDLQGFNLVGNPYYHTYTLNERCYSLTTDGSWLVHNSSYDLSIAEAVMVNTTTARTFTFTENTSKGSHSVAPALAFTVKGNGLQDVAYATLTEGDGMPKMSHFNENTPVLSIPVDGRRYAIADLGTDCQTFDMTFRGIEGEYTLTLTANRQTLNYCHLIDRATGNDIDLLAQNTYTFTHSNTNTLSDRFQVKLSPNVEENTTANFAYWNGNAWIVEGTGTLEVYDVLGRKIFTENVNSQLSIVNSQFPATGVYVLRLGNMNQKIVVR